MPLKTFTEKGIFFLQFKENLFGVQTRLKDYLIP